MNCPFCPSAQIKGARGEMQEDLFTAVLDNLKENVQELFFHVLGDPLLHPKLAEFLALAGSRNFKVNLTTNGLLIAEKGPIILTSPFVRQVNFSTHALAYLDAEFAGNSLSQIFAFADKVKEVRPDLYINFRLWNEKSDSISETWNVSMLKELSEHYGVDVSLEDFKVRHKSIPLQGRIYLHRDSRFDWPGTKEEQVRECGTCHALIDQCAILCDGRIVPCCLDYAGKMTLGKIPEDSFESIMRNSKTNAMRNGFANNVLIEEFCKKCSFSKRFPV